MKGRLLTLVRQFMLSPNLSEFMSEKSVGRQSFKVNESLVHLAYDTNVTVNVMLRLLMEIRAQAGDKTLDEIEKQIQQWAEQQVDITRQLLENS